MKQSQKAFTLIELLVVIAIIGILSQIVLTNMSSAKIRARLAVAESSLRAVMPAVTSCLDESSTVVQPTASADGLGAEPTGVNAGGNDVCLSTVAVSAVWPELPVGWYYTTNNFNGSAGSAHIEISGDGYTCVLTETGVSGC